VRFFFQPRGRAPARDREERLAGADVLVLALAGRATGRRRSRRRRRAALVVDSRRRGAPTPTDGGVSFTAAPTSSIPQKRKRQPRGDLGFRRERFRDERAVQRRELRAQDVA
jgi:hypothetical protein